METRMDNIKMERYPEYKDSGVEWLGEVPEDWEVVPGFKIIAERKEKNTGMKENKVLSLSYGNVIVKPDEKLTGLVPESFETYQLVYIGDIIIRPTDLQNDKTSLRTGLAKNEGIITSAYINLKVKNDNSSQYYHYFLHCVDTTKVIYGMGSGLRQNLDFRDFRRFKFLLPTPSEQTRIAAFLDRKTAQIDQAIAQKERLIELLKERRQILIHNAVTRGLNPKVRMKNSGVDWIGAVPEGWEVVKNHAIFEERNESGNESLPILSISIHTAVSNEEMNEEENIRGKIRIQDKSSYKIVRINDVAFNMMRAWQGAIGAVRTEGMVSPAYVVAKPKVEIDADFFEFQYRTPIFIQQMDRFSKGITDFRKRLYWHEFKQLITVLPPINEQKAVSKFILNLNSKIESAIALKQAEIEKLKEYKATLINAAVTGKIKISVP